MSSMTKKKNNPETFGNVVVFSSFLLVICFTDEENCEVYVHLQLFT